MTPLSMHVIQISKKLVCGDSGRELELEREKKLTSYQRNLQLLLI